MFKTEEAKHFFAAWQALRKGGEFPHYRAVFQDLPNEFLPQALIFEQVFDPGAEGAKSKNFAEGAKSKNFAEGTKSKNFAEGANEGAPLDRYMVRFMGTRVAEYWNRDITGHDMFALMSPKVAAAGRRNMATVLSHPCGLISVGVFTIASRDELAVESVIVPTANDPGRSPRILGFVQHLLAPFPVEDDRRDVAERRWLDIGSGIPDRKPAK